MRVLLYLSALVLVGVLATWAYRVNYATQAALDRVAALQAELAREHEAVSVLEAEWAYLNRPDRLRALVAQHKEILGLEPMKPEQFGSLSGLPFPVEEIDPLAVRGATP